MRGADNGSEMILNYDHYRTGQRRKRSRMALIPLFVVLAGALVGGVFLLHLPARLLGAAAGRPAPGKLSDLFRDQKYGDVITVADGILAGDPMNAVALSYRGFASFYKAVSADPQEEKIPSLDQAIVSLRRARIAGTPFPGETDYVLGKAYFNKGKYYYDLAISSMESSLARGYVQKDSHEYIGQAWNQLGDNDKAIAEFLTALKDDSGDLLLLTIGQTYYQMKRYSDAVDYLLRTLNKTEDKAIEEQARFRLGDIYLSTNELFKAEEQFAAIVKADPQSADAHFDLGEVYNSMSDPVKARAEWRQALIIDPSHYGARLRYYGGKK
jgi:tetratricopeptide (TPR) repeat protein